MEEREPQAADTDHRHQQARLLTLKRDAARSIGVNLEEGAKLAHDATLMAASFGAQAGA